MPRRDLKGEAMFLFEERAIPASPKGKNREPRLEENSVRNFTGSQIPLRLAIQPITPTMSGFFVAFYDEKYSKTS